MLPHLFNPSRTATLVPEFPVVDMPLSRTVAIILEFAVRSVLGQNTLKMISLGDEV